MRGAARASLALAAAALLCLGAGAARAELTQQGGLLVSFDSQLAPRALPRHVPAPVGITVAGSVKAKAGARLPQLRTISVAINRFGRLYDRGIPTCRVAAIQPATEAAARALCGRSIVGTGAVTVETRLEGQEPFEVHASLLAFNGPTVHGHKEILAQVYSRSPPGAFVLVFHLQRRPGLFGTVMSTSLPRAARSWAYLTSFRMTLRRLYRQGGKLRSYVSAACAAPAGFPGAVFPFARATYGFDDGRRLTTRVVRSCKVAE